MARAHETLEISQLPEVARLAEQVRASRVPWELRRGNEIIATMVPAARIPARRPTRQYGREADKDGHAFRSSARGGPSVVAMTAGIFKDTMPPLAAEELRVAAEEAIAEDVEGRAR